MSNTHAPDQSAKAAGVKYITDHAIGLALIEATFWSASDDARRVLTAMLKQC